VTAGVAINGCGRPSCTCTHTPPCDHGWIETDDQPPVHCPTCHPGRRQHPDETPQQWQARLQREDAAWARKHAAQTTNTGV